MTPGGTRAEGSPALRAGTVTALVVRGERGQQVAVHVDGELAFQLAAEVVAGACLCRGQYLSEEEQALLLEENQRYTARECALSILSRRESSRHDLGVKLRRRGFEDGVAEKTVAWLEERGLVDDRRYAAAVVRERLKAGWGRRRIVSELLRKGVARDLVVGEAWDGLRDEGVDEDGFGVALALARRRFGSQLAADPVGTKRRMAAFLGRRGHDWDTIGRVTRQLCTEIGDEEGTEPPAVD